MLIDDDTLLITKSGELLPEFETPTSFTGSLEEFESDIRTQVIEKIRADLPADMRNMIYPRLLDITEFENKFVWIIGGVVCIIVVLVSVVMILRGLGGMLSRTARPVERSI
jgi:hypothetical protein